MLPELDEIGRKRRKLGLKQTQLAEISGTSQSLIAKVESGKIDPSYSNAKAVFDALEKLEEKEALVARDIMTRKIVGVSKSEKMADAVKLMKKYKISQLPVFDGDHVVGMVGEGTVMDKIGQGGDLTSVPKSPVENLMDDPPPRVDELAPVSVLSALLKHSQAVLIVKKEKTIGIVTKADLLKVVSK